MSEPHSIPKRDRKDYYKKRLRRLIVNGLCTRCGQRPPDKEKRTCRWCLRKMRQKPDRRKRKQKYGDRQRRYAAKPSNREKIKERVKKYQKTAKGKAQRERYAIKLKYEVMSAYSGSDIPQCVCCGEAEIAFLTLDHVNNDRCKHQMRGYGGTRWYKWLRIRGFPNDPLLQTLCFNCNCGKRTNKGICPHQQRKRQTQ